MAMAARVGDDHVCPLFNPPPSGSPHKGGPILGPGQVQVLIENMPASVVGDICVCAGPPDQIVKGSSSVFIGGKPAARIGDLTQHGGSITQGCSTVNIGG